MRLSMTTHGAECPVSLLPLPTDRNDVLDAMRSCSQSAGVSVLKHGMLVNDAYERIRAYIAGEPSPDGWRLPDWTRDALVVTYNASLSEADLAIIREYQIFHDCGKPYVRIEDADGRVHFPDHARMSGRIWESVGGHPVAARLMTMDMDAHLLKSGDVAEFASRPEALTLLITALAEVHANATMFGGLDSDSFKIKAKHLDKRGRQVLSLIRATSN